MYGSFDSPFRLREAYLEKNNFQFKYIPQNVSKRATLTFDQMIMKLEIDNTIFSLDTLPFLEINCQKPLMTFTPSTIIHFFHPCTYCVTQAHFLCSPP